MTKLIHFTLFLVVLIVTKTDTAKILGVFPFPSISHQVVFRPLTQELAKRGHELTIITTDPAYPNGIAPQNLTEIDLHDMSYDIWKKALLKIETVDKNILTQLKVILAAMTEISETQFKSPELKGLLNRTRTFDLILAEACMKPSLVFSHIYKAPVIMISSFGSMLYNNALMGAPTHPLLYPTAINQRIHDLTVWDKIGELYKYFKILLYIEEEQISNDDAMLKRVFGPNVPGIHELGNNVDMLFLNSHRIWEGNFPVPPGIVHIGGIHKKEKQILPQDLKSYLDASENGVIYMSFGSHLLPSTLSPEKIQAFVKVFSELPYNILWKWDKDELPGQTKNIKTGKWFPQADLLKHKNVKLFITQGGLQSTEESIFAGVPLIGVPMLTDQWYNVDKYRHFKIGKRLNLETLKEDEIRDAITTVLGDDSYRQNIIKLRSLMHDQPDEPLQRAIWWTEHILRHKGGKHLRSPAANLSWTEYYELPLVVSILSLVLVFVAVCVLSLRFGLSFLMSKSVKFKKQ